MRIDNTDISQFEARQWNFEFNHNSVSNNSEWAAHAALPYFARNTIGFQQFTLTLMMKGSGREAIRRNCSQILALLVEPVELALDGFETKFRAIMTGHSEDERSLRKYHLLHIQFDGYEHGDMVTATGASSITLRNPGNMVSPGIVTITPRIGAASITLNGISRDSITGDNKTVTIKTIVNGKVVTLDGITGLITEDGSPREVEMWTLPTFLPGNNTITCDNSNMTIQAQVLPLYI